MFPARPRSKIPVIDAAIKNFTGQQLAIQIKKMIRSPSTAKNSSQRFFELVRVLGAKTS